MIFSQETRFHLLATIPTIIIMLNLRDIELKEIMYFPASFFICLERFCTYHETHAVIFTLTFIHCVVQHLKVGVRPI